MGNKQPAQMYDKQQCRITEPIQKTSGILKPLVEIFLEATTCAASARRTASSSTETTAAAAKTAAE